MGDGSVDAVISNGVINLSPDKAAVFSEVRSRTAVSRAVSPSKAIRTTASRCSNGSAS